MIEVILLLLLLTLSSINTVTLIAVTRSIRFIKRKYVSESLISTLARLESKLEELELALTQAKSALSRQYVEQQEASPSAAPPTSIVLDPSDPRVKQIRKYLSELKGQKRE